MRARFYAAAVCLMLACAGLLGSFSRGGAAASQSKEHHAGGALDVKVTPVGPTQADLDLQKQRILQDAAVRRSLSGRRVRIVSFELEDLDDKAVRRLDPPSRYRAAVFDYDANRAAAVQGDFVTNRLSVASLSAQPEPGLEEF